MTKQKQITKVLILRINMYFPIPSFFQITTITTMYFYIIIIIIYYLITPYI